MRAVLSESFTGIGYFSKTDEGQRMGKKHILLIVNIVVILAMAIAIIAQWVNVSKIKKRSQNLYILLTKKCKSDRINV